MTQEKEELKEEEPIAPEVQEEELKQESEAPKDEYEAELARITGERDNYKEGMLIAKEKNKELKKPEETKEEIETRIESKIEAKFASLKEDSVSDSIEDALEAVSSSESEKKLILHHYKRLEKSGYSKTNILDDIEDAKLLANKKSIIKENSELRESLKARQSIGNAGLGANVKKNYEPEVKLSGAEQGILDRMNSRRVKDGREPMSANDFKK